MTDLPAPLTPPDCDLRGLEWMPLYGDRLFASETWILASAEGKVAALALWWAAWRQAPAGSLPNDDRILAQLAGYGAARKAWLAIRGEAMRGWIPCSDGRVYHPTVCNLAIDAYERRIRDRQRKAKFRAGRSTGDAGQSTDTRDQETRQERGQDAGIPVPSASCPRSVRADRTRQDRTRQEKEKETPQPPAPAGTGGASANDSQEEEAAEDRPPGWQGQWRGLRSTGGNPRAQAAPPPPPPIAEPTDPLWPRLRAQGVKIHDWRAWIARLHRETLPTGETRIIAPDAAHAARIRANYAIPLAAALRTRIVVEVASA